MPTKLFFTVTKGLLDSDKAFEKCEVHPDSDAHRHFLDVKARDPIIKTATALIQLAKSEVEFKGLPTAVVKIANAALHHDHAVAILLEVHKVQIIQNTLRDAISDTFDRLSTGSLRKKLVSALDKWWYSKCNRLG